MTFIVESNGFSVVAHALMMSLKRICQILWQEASHGFEFNKSYQFSFFVILPRLYVIFLSRLFLLVFQCVDLPCNIPNIILSF